MPTSTKTTKAATAAVAAMPSIAKEFVDQFVTGPMSAQAVNAASTAFKKALIERAVGAVPSHREGSFEPVLIPKRDRRFTGVGDHTVAPYARGVAHILIAVTDGPNGIGEALGAVLPATTLQTFIVPPIRNSLNYASWKDRCWLQPCGRRTRRPGAGPGTGLIPFFTFSPEVRRVVCTTNATESVHSQLRKTFKTLGHFPSDDAATKLVWLALRNVTADRSRAAKEWKPAMNQFALL